jgi:hypothetical protein
MVPAAANTIFVLPECFMITDGETKDREPQPVYSPILLVLSFFSNWAHYLCQVDLLRFIGVFIVSAGAGAKKGVNLTHKSVNFTPTSR